MAVAVACLGGVVVTRGRTTEFTKIGAMFFRCRDVYGGMVVVAAAAVAKAVSSMTGMSREDVDAAIDQQAIEAAVDERGMAAVTDPELLESAINHQQLDAPIDTDDLQQALEEQI